VIKINTETDATQLDAGRSKTDKLCRNYCVCHRNPLVARTDPSTTIEETSARGRDAIFNKHALSHNGALAPMSAVSSKNECRSAETAGMNKGQWLVAPRIMSSAGDAPARRLRTVLLNRCCGRCTCRRSRVRRVVTATLSISEPLFGRRGCRLDGREFGGGAV
jgi:hypothetical protein